ncbi:pyridoxal-phosphate dependent enzyme [Acidimangrovimonas pyrenivorans]|uniref:Pyridoxal-phosphate dependent enzyme n=1 Tax=Acidimangrovimonas pyrenivorans TaxID=2030798 RepID=A0ABV7AE01_9RHOB
MEILLNPHRGRGLPELRAGGLPRPVDDASEVSRRLAQCPVAAKTPLRDLSEMAAETGIAKLWLKDESGRMGLGSFKALGAAHAIAREAELSGAEDLRTALAGRSFVTASAGNHGLSVAAGAHVFGARAVIYLAETVPEAFADRLRAKGAEVRRDGAVYEDSMAAAARAAETEGMTLLSDSSWPGYWELPLRVIEGYLQLAAEAAEELPEPPTHVLLQAGVGGLAAAVAAFARARWGAAPKIVVVEPAYAPALIESIRAGKIVTSAGPVSTMGRLDCKDPSLLALAGLAEDADVFATIGEEEAQAAVEKLATLGLATTPSGAAGLAGLLAAGPRHAALGLGPDSRVLAILSEGAEAP